MPSIQLVLPGQRGHDGTAPAGYISSGVVPPTILPIIIPETQHADLAPDWVETDRPGTIPSLNFRAEKRPKYSFQTVLYHEDQGMVKTELDQLQAHARGMYGVIFAFDNISAHHRWAIQKLEYTVPEGGRRERDNEPYVAVVDITLVAIAPNHQGVAALPGLPAGPILPAVAPPLQPARRPDQPRRHTIGAGQTLWDIALVVYGNGSLWRKIAAANGITDVRRLRVGQVIVLP